LNKVGIAFVGCLAVIAILVVSNLWLFATTTSQINDSQTQLNDRNKQIQTLQNQVDNLSDRIVELETEVQASNESYVALNESYTELLREYEDLLFHYNLLNGPASNFTTFNDLDIKFSLDYTTYYYQDPVSGNVTITYLNGTAFRGAFILYIRHLTEGMSTTAEIAIDEFTEFYLSPPVFRFGPGNYTIGISSLSTADGYIIESRWQVFPSVQVEAK